MANIQRMISLLLVFVCCSVKANTWFGGEEGMFFSENIKRISKKKTKEIAKYLTKFGYSSTYTEKINLLEESIKDFQFFGGLNVTGELDLPTEALMKTSRCGLKDPNVRAKRQAEGGRGGRFRRYNHQGTIWMKNILTWRYKHNPTSLNGRRLTEDQVRDTMKKAMSLWEEKTNIEFVEDREATQPDVWVTFVSYRHNDPYPFDGQGGTLAHAFYPLNNKGLAGDVHFDDSEKFTIGSDSGNYGKDLMWVAVHELGHTLGLDHSHEEGAIMYPFYTGYKENIQLAYDDTVGIQTLYGGKIKKTTEAPKTITTTRKPIPKNRRCPRTKLTAMWDYGKHHYIAVSEDENLYIVSNKENTGMIYANLPAKGYFRIPHKISAVLQTNLGSTSNPVYSYIFTDGGFYWEYNGFQKKSGPYSIHDGNGGLRLRFPTWVQKIDAVFKWWVNKKIYFFSGHQYWRYNEEKKQIDKNYPKRISDGWFGIPTNNLDAAYSSIDATIFIKGNKIYRIKERPKPMKLMNGYPKSINDDFLKCIEE